MQPEYRKIYVKKRPYVDDFLKEMSKHFEIVMFTASVERYAVPLFERLDPKGNIIDSQLFRQHCTLITAEHKSYTKDLTMLGRPMKDIIIVDNSPHAYSFQPSNALPSITWEY